MDWHRLTIDCNGQGLIQITAIDATWYGVNELRNKGYSLVAVDTCLGGAGEWPYEYIGQPQQQDGSWTC